MPQPITFDSFQAEIKRLVETFDKNLAAYKGAGYNEASLRQEFLDPMLRALGWDLENKAGLILRHREVEIESRTMVSGRHKRADYLFRTDREDRFVCEAKKPAEELNARASFQAKRYAWNKGLPLAVLSDFEEMKIFIVGGKPFLDEPDVGLWKSWHFRQYLDVAPEIWDLLARQNVAEGSIDRLIEALPKKPVGKGRGKMKQQWLIKPDRSRSLDVDFLNFLDESRRTLAADLLKHNDRADLLEGTRLNEAVQRILDRILFLRICEDRDIDTGTRLDSIVETWRRNFCKDEGRRSYQWPLELREPPPDDYGFIGIRAPKDSLWRALVRHFRALDRRPPSHVPFFNGNLFKSHFSEELVVGDEWLAGFVADLSDEESPYLFNYIAVEILGTIYERFLGKIVRPQGRGVTIEEKPEVRKAGGVYYTPSYIVEYIVAQTVEKLLRDTQPEASLKLRFLDPACGSGSFLLRVFEAVCEYWEQWLTDHPDQRKKAWCWVDEANNSVQLTMSLKRQILTSNIFGVDLDPGAVEVTQLSLYLKMLENENRNTLQRQRELLPDDDDPLLPPLENNIKCGNSLIASDFSMVPDDLVRVRAFDWNVGFKDIMKAGGFDAVVGNPPWIDIKGLDPIQTDHFFKAYTTVVNRMNIYAVFMHRAVELLKPDGLLGFITPSSFLTQSSYEKLRNKLHALQIVAVVRTPDNVFEGVSAETAISIYAKSKSVKPVQVLVYPATADIARISTDNGATHRSIDQADWLNCPSCIFNLHLVSGVNALLAKIGNCGNHLLDVCEFCLGLTPYDKAKGHSRAQIEGRVFHSTTKQGKTWKPLLEGGDIQRFFVEFGGAEYINYGPWLGAPRDSRFFTQPRILVRQIISGSPPRIYAGYTEQELYNTQIAFNLLVRPRVRESLKYILGVMNSRLITWFHRERFLDPNKTTFQKILIQDAKTFPIYRIDFSNPADKSRHDKLVALVDKMLGLMPKLRQARNESERETLQNAVTATDRQIDELVYEFYGLTEEEIKLVESN